MFNSAVHQLINLVTKLIVHRTRGTLNKIGDQLVQCFVKRIQELLTRKFKQTIGFKS